MAIMAVAAMAADADNSPYIARVYDYMPAPSQFVNVYPAYKPGYTRDSILTQLEASLVGRLDATVSLGSYGGYIVFGSIPGSTLGNSGEGRFFPSVGEGGETSLFRCLSLDW